MKKYFSLLPALFFVILVSCGGGNKDAEIAQLKEEIAQLKSQQNSQQNSSISEETYSTQMDEPVSQNQTEQSIESAPQKTTNYIGTYTFTDGLDNNWNIILNSDNTAQIKNQNKTFYCEYSISSTNDNVVIIDVSGGHDPYIPVSGGKKECFYYPTMDLENLYLYNSTTAYKAKNPELRLKLKKIN